MPNLSWYEAIEQTLRKTGSVMHITDLAEQIGRDGLREKIGATPAATVSAAISQSLKNEGAASPFRQVGPGEYILRDVASSAQANSPVQNEPTTEPDEVVTAGGIIQAFGMYWERESVLWKNEPKLWGRQQEDADRVDFSRPERRLFALRWTSCRLCWTFRSGNYRATPI